MNWPHRADDLKQLEAANRVYLSRILGNPRMRLISSALAPLRERVVTRYAEQAIAFDEDVAAHGLRAAAQRWVERFTRELVISGAAHVPATGPVVFVGNHPGSYDMDAALAAIARDDLKTFVADVPYYRILKHFARDRFIYVTDESAGQRREAAAVSAQHVQQGGALLLFPGGNIEPEPAFEARADERLGTWHRSLDLLARWTPELRVVPMAISGILHPASNRSLIKRLLKIESAKERENLAVAIRLFLPRLRTRRVSITFGAPLAAIDPAVPSRSLTERARDALGSLLAEAAGDPSAAADARTA